MRGIHADVIRGSIGGNTFLANQFHQIVIRQRTSPVNPSSSNQGLVRQAFSGAAVDWKALTPAQRTDWDNYADTLTFPNPLGPIQIPGRQVFMGNIGWFRYLVARGVSFASPSKLAPVSAGFLSLDPLLVLEPEPGNTGFRISVGNVSTSDIQVAFQVSTRFDLSRNLFKGPFRSNSLITLALEGETVGVQEFYFGSDDDVYFVRIRAIVDDGPKKLSQDVILRCVVSTTAV